MSDTALIDEVREIRHRIAEKIKVQELREEAIKRIKSIYANDSDVKPNCESQVARLYAQRMRNLK